MGLDGTMQNLRRRVHSFVEMHHSVTVLTGIPKIKPGRIHFVGFIWITLYLLRLEQESVTTTSGGWSAGMCED